MKINRIRRIEGDIKRIVRECVSEFLKKNIIAETHMRNLYHFISPKQLQYITKYGFGLNDKEPNYSISPKLPNFLSFTRNRNASQGFPYMNSKYSGGGGTFHNNGPSWLIIRLEIDAKTLSHYGKVKPFDYIYKLNKEEGEVDCNSSREEVAMMAAGDYNISDDEEVYRQPFSQAEERLFSKLKRIPKEKSLKLIKRIDVWVDTEEMKAYHESKKQFDAFMRWLHEKFHNIPVVIYKKIGEFNIQAKPTI